MKPRNFQEYEAIIFVIDSADRLSFQEARDELWSFLKFAPDEMDHPVLLIMANKQDLENSATKEELKKVLGRDHSQTLKGDYTTFPLMTN